MNQTQNTQPNANTNAQTVIEPSLVATDERRQTDEPAVDTVDIRTANPRRGRPARRLIATLLVAVTAALGVVVTTATPASAAAGVGRTYSSVSCGSGRVNTTVGMVGGQYVMLQYAFTSPLGYTSYSNWQTPFWAPSNSTNIQATSFTPGWRGYTAVYVRTAYWNGSRWYFVSGFEQIKDTWSCNV